LKSLELDSFSRSSFFSESCILVYLDSAIYSSVDFLESKNHSQSHQLFLFVYANNIIFPAAHCISNIIDWIHILIQYTVKFDTVWHETITSIGLERIILASNSVGEIDHSDTRQFLYAPLGTILIRIWHFSQCIVSLRCTILFTRVHTVKLDHI
jgi:hypothetical protein